MKNLKRYHIGELAKQFSISQRTLRYYEELNLISPERTEGGFRLYDSTQVERLKTILILKELGMSLDEIYKLLLVRKSGNNGGTISNELIVSLKAKRDEFKKMVEKYKEGIEEINETINVLEKCRGCLKPVIKCECERCMEERGDKVSRLTKTLL